MYTRFRGLIAAPFTPFHADCSLNLGVIPAYARWLRGNGVRGAFVCGTTGEGLSMTLDERRSVAEQWMRFSDADLPVIVHVGDTCIENARVLAAHAASIGAAAVSAIAPIFFKPRTVEDLIDWCEAVAAAAPSVPFYFYHIPSLSGVTLPVAEFLKKAAGRIPTLAGVKYTHEDLDDYAACLRAADGRFDVVFGRDELLLEAWTRGAGGAIGSTYNYVAPLYHAILEAHTGNDPARARALQDASVTMIKACQCDGVAHLATGKALMRLLGLDCGPVRLPLREPSATQLATLHRKLADMGLFDFACRAPRASTTGA